MSLSMFAPQILSCLVPLLVFASGSSFISFPGLCFLYASSPLFASGHLLPGTEPACVYNGMNSDTFCLPYRSCFLPFSRQPLVLLLHSLPACNFPRRHSDPPSPASLFAFHFTPILPRAKCAILEYAPASRVAVLCILLHTRNRNHPLHKQEICNDCPPDYRSSRPSHSNDPFA